MLKFESCFWCKIDKSFYKAILLYRTLSSIFLRKTIKHFISIFNKTFPWEIKGNKRARCLWEPFEQIGHWLDYLILKYLVCIQCQAVAVEYWPREYFNWLQNININQSKTNKIPRFFEWNEINHTFTQGQVVLGLTLNLLDFFKRCITGGGDSTPMIISWRDNPHHCPNKR